MMNLRQYSKIDSIPRIAIKCQVNPLPILVKHRLFPSPRYPVASSKAGQSVIMTIVSTSSMHLFLQTVQLGLSSNSVLPFERVLSCSPLVGCAETSAPQFELPRLLVVIWTLGTPRRALRTIKPDWHSNAEIFRTIPLRKIMKMEELRFDDQTVVVTGAGGG